MNTYHFLITGPIRPNIKYINKLITDIKEMFIHHTIKIYLCYWCNETIDKNLIKNVDYLFPENEPKDDYIYENVKKRTIQQKQIHPNIEHWTVSIYKMFYGIKKLVNNIDNNSLINDDDIVLKFRTDLYIQNINLSLLNNLLNNINKNSYYFCPRSSGGNSCDWFGFSSYKIFKKIWFIKDNKEYNDTIENLWNAENIVLYKSKLFNIKLVDVNSIFKFALCRKYENKDNFNIKEYHA
jgi:hypothetical protein